MPDYSINVCLHARMPVIQIVPESFGHVCPAFKRYFCAWYIGRFSAIESHYISLQVLVFLFLWRDHGPRCGHHALGPEFQGGSQGPPVRGLEGFMGLSRESLCKLIMPISRNLHRSLLEDSLAQRTGSTIDKLPSTRVTCI